jgi:hypothetical protein
VLFEIRPGLKCSKVFDGLNRYLIEIMLAALEGRPLDQTGLVSGLVVAINENPLTRNAVDALVATLHLMDPVPRQELIGTLKLNTSPCAFLIDHSVMPLRLPEKVFAALKALTEHLYERTSSLKKVRGACGECVHDHYSRFRATAAPGNGNVCCVCGTEPLAQLRAGVDGKAQWRGPYDHILAIAKYPLYGIDPRNLLPICGTCNSKAKLAKDLLIDSKGKRRIAFSPWFEVAVMGEIKVSIDDADLSPRVNIEFISEDALRQEKLRTWDDVFGIKSRVEGEFLALQEKISEDARAANDAEFLLRLREQAGARWQAVRQTPFNYWRVRVYAAVCAMAPASRAALRQVAARPLQADPEMDALFGL